MKSRGGGWGLSFLKPLMCLQCYLCSRLIVPTDMNGGDVKSRGPLMSKSSSPVPNHAWGCELQWKHASSVGYQMTRPVPTTLAPMCVGGGSDLTSGFLACVESLYLLWSKAFLSFLFFPLLCGALACSVSCLNAVSCSQHRWHERHTELWRKTQGTHLGACRMTLWWNKLNVHTATLQHCCNLLFWGLKLWYFFFLIYLFYYIFSASDVSEQRLNGFLQTLVSTRNLRA